ncbi:MAG: NUDIX hydrolase [Sulfobacillus thermosulfidooxidans]|nr:MAG: NUDIX hydrolase [Sulfobacillus thermosulfidooxidans]
MESVTNDRTIQVDQYCALFMIRDNLVLLLRRFNTVYEDGNYSVPAGYLDGGEQIKSAAIRKAKEECGISISPSDLEVVGVMHRQAGDERIDFFLATRSWAGDIVNTEPHKCDDLRWYSTDDLPDNMFRYVKQALTNYMQGIWFSEFGWG